MTKVYAKSFLPSHIRKKNFRYKSRNIGYSDLSNGTNYDNDFEFYWVDYVSKCLHSLWALYDEPQRLHDRERSNDLVLILNLAKDLKNFDFDQSFDSSETIIWNVFRITTTSRILKEDTLILEALSAIEEIEKTRDFLFKNGLKELIFCAKTECYIGLYTLLDSSTTTSQRVGFEIGALEKEINLNYHQILQMIDRSLSVNTNPDSLNYPDNPYLLSRVAVLIENTLTAVSVNSYIIDDIKFSSKKSKLSKIEKEKIRKITSPKLNSYNCDMEIFETERLTGKMLRANIL